MSSPFLTIAIPTFNRAGYLYKCLQSLLGQVECDIENDIEIVVSDNASTDNTCEVVRDINKCKNFYYYRNEENLGMDGNFLACYRYAKGKFVWIFSDDDLLRPNSLKLILNLLKENDNCGACYIDSEWFEEIDIRKISPIGSLEYKINTSSIGFLESVNYWVTFLTGNIVNKDLVDRKVYTEENMGTMLVQLSWVIPAIFSSNKNIFISSKLILCKLGNTGGYKLFEVFGKNFNKIIDSFISKGYDSKIKTIINNKLIRNFFPVFISSDRSSFNNESVFKLLFSLYWNYSAFWSVIIPIFVKKQFKKI
ncbi:glycosyltransferase family 2 protein [Hymenobacter sp. BT186]|uniref:Glycosyltransferase family 2 protein n=1 Tax=Hymenobacter telluris TaxID=2816474 RepID=A0A939ETS6_9BACT|nr:glycosyltransferase family 2 protein [Hymenobacter telluris]MBO0357375.1 glycosyltransferase family 2 protein [Hymenobacter telluris]MBW3373401.1 glycosyltransferase family 2 protein [Hymenobacter norwichensis]